MVGRGTSTLLCPGAYNAIKMALCTSISILVFWLSELLFFHCRAIEYDFLGNFTLWIYLKIFLYVLNNHADILYDKHIPVVCIYKIA